MPCIGWGRLGCSRQPGEIEIPGLGTVTVEQRNIDAAHRAAREQNRRLEDVMLELHDVTAFPGLKPTPELCEYRSGRVI